MYQQKLSWHNLYQQFEKQVTSTQNLKGIFKIKIKKEINKLWNPLTT